MRHPNNASSQSFPRKLWEILENEDPDVVGWSDSGNAFFIRSMELFIDEILTKYFRHNKFSSFQRQLNLYGFKKVNKGPESGAYSMSLFDRAHPEHLNDIKRSPQPSASTSRRASSSSRRKQSIGNSSDEEDDAEDPARQNRSLFGDCLSRSGRLQRRRPATAMTTPAALQARKPQNPSLRMQNYRAYDQQFLRRAGGVPAVMRGDSLSSGYLDKKLQELAEGHPYSNLIGMPGRLSRSSSLSRSASTSMDMDSFSYSFTNRASLTGQEAVPVAVAIPLACPPVPTAMLVPSNNTANGGLAKPSFIAPSVSRSNSLQLDLDDIDLAKALDTDNLDAFWDPKPIGDPTAATAVTAPAPVTATRNVTYDPMMGNAPSFNFTMAR